MSRYKIESFAVALLALFLSREARADGGGTLGREALSLLRSRCAECHGGAKPKGRLDLTSFEALGRGGKKGPAVAPGKPADSLLWKRVSAREMPPEKPLDDSEQAVLRRWIQEGAPGLPRAAGRPAAPPVHWAFRPISRPIPPVVREEARVRNDVDRFIEAALEKSGLALGPDADRATLLRRVSFDLTGLPPLPGEVAAFLADPAPDAYEQMVERFLASPRYGERWGAYWLEAAGYADSNGYFSADSDRPLAWRYRDYVVRSFNEDKPLDRFVEEQLAGDELAAFDPEGDLTAPAVDLLTATHFLRNAQDGTGESDGNDLEQLADKLAVLDGTVQIVGSSLLGLTLGCARCHDHKFDPITQVEYYRLQAVLTGAYTPQKWIKPDDRAFEIGTRAEREANHQKRDAAEKGIKAIEDALKALAEPFRKRLVEERLAALEEPGGSVLRQALKKAKGERSEEEKALLKKHEALLEPKDDDLNQRFEEYKSARAGLQTSLEARKKELPAPLPQVAALTDIAVEPPAHRLLVAGLPSQPGPDVEPGVPAILCSSANSYRVERSGLGPRSTGRRRALARWIVSRENPLFARVMANRVWAQRFGTGLAATPENLGVSGAEPSHPELLDWLAGRLIDGGFRLKDLHRLLLTSAAYRQSSAARGQSSSERGQSSAARGTALELDPDNRLVSRWRARRLDAESVRDAMLLVTGELDRRSGGPPVATTRDEQGQVVANEKEDGAFRRSVYLQKRRTQPLTMLEVFDAPLIVGSCTRRSVSTTPLQSLALLNSEFALARAKAFAKRLEKEAGPRAADRVSLAFLLALGRGPAAEERAIADRFLETQRREYPPVEAEERIWTDLCQMVFASSSFLYVD